MDPNLLLWIGQIALAVAFLGFGYAHSIDFERTSARPRLGWMTSVGRDRMRVIGSLEILGAFGLVLPAVTGILAWLTPTAAASLLAVTALATIFHWRRGELDSRRIVSSVVLGVIAALVAYGRFVVAPL
jgi:DoxX-like protein